MFFFVQPGCDFNDSQTKPELLALSKGLAVEKTYQVDEMAREAGHEVIRLPPYHCHLNPIELLWAYTQVGFICDL